MQRIRTSSVVLKRVLASGGNFKILLVLKLETRNIIEDIEFDFKPRPLVVLDE